MNEIPENLTREERLKLSQKLMDSLSTKNIMDLQKMPLYIESFRYKAQKQNKGNVLYIVLSLLTLLFLGVMFLIFR